MDDGRLLPFAAMYEIDRDSLCLTEIDPDSEVYIDALGGRGYDVVLQLHNGNVSRTIAFILEGGRYVWIGEQEVHRSGRKFVTPDGTLPELIAITYHEREYGFSHEPPGLIISYQGESEITSGLTCEQALTYIREWGTGASDTE